MVLEHIKAIAPPKLIQTPSTCYHYTDEQLTHLTCSICYSIVSQPIELGCNSLVCAACCQEWLEVSGDTYCPVCYHRQLEKATIMLYKQSLEVGAAEDLRKKANPKDGPFSASKCLARGATGVPWCYLCRKPCA